MKRGWFSLNSVAKGEGVKLPVLLLKVSREWSRDKAGILGGETCTENGDVDREDIT
jgi:hypothetical protein